MLDKVADFAGKVRGPGVIGMGAMFVESLLRTASDQLRTTDVELDELRRRLVTPRNLEMPWDRKPSVPDEDTKREKRPSKEPPK